jgi:hypothetical protein
VSPPLHALALGSALVALSVAPFQCPSKPDPSKVREDTPGEALYELAGQFKTAGDKEGQIRTLRYLAEKYPRSRFAVQARDDLKGLGVTLPEPPMAVDPEREGVPRGRMPGEATSASAAARGSDAEAPVPSASSGSAAHDPAAR